ncbi:DNA polymerase Y family protein [Amycolatopsis alkalitolerans]|uniref:DNA polymerase Y family protein n=1 Tax=Amycolatopsis alkalitolerans TaxID=2547244 RepID=A0A5C4LRW5_9PSEU|nr:DNA polymerase Y family protein [Amycolatopsis alkalitolerans]TNC21616.1 DNA polymerase Y family protein [Amycolatopsis alkalitolerans]
MNPPIRLLAVWCPDWPVVAAGAAAGVPAHLPAAVFAANRVIACSPAARVAGVRRDMRRREAQSRCPELAVFAVDGGRDARLFEPVAAAVEELAVGVEVVRPGLVAVPADGAAGYFGGEQALAERLIDQVAARAGVECQIGIADGLFGATLAARRSAIVDLGSTKDFLAPMGIGVLRQQENDRGELVDLLHRLGLRTLGAFAALTERDVLSRFGHEGLLAHRLANGLSERPPHRRRPSPELSAFIEFDPPLERVDSAVFVAKPLAERFHAGLAAHGLACTRLGIYAATEGGEELSRVWRCAEPLGPHGIAARVRWQFEGWLNSGTRPTAGVVRLRLDPEETIEGDSLQLGLWRGGAVGGSSEQDEQAGRVLDRVQGLLGPESVFTAVLDGGRGPAERARLVPWGDRREVTSPPEMPWPGRLPAPSPATVFAEPVPARVVDVAGEPVALTRRRELAAPPSVVVLPGTRPRQVLDWGGPWVAEPVWGEPGGQVRIQALLAGDPALAVLLTGTYQEIPEWTVEGVYD